MDGRGPTVAGATTATGGGSAAGGSGLLRAHGTQGVPRRAVLRAAGIAAVVPFVVAGTALGAGAAPKKPGGGKGKPVAPEPAPAPEPVPVPEVPASADFTANLAAAFAFLDERVSLAPGTEGFLPRSYTSGFLGSIGYDVAFVYDCALVVLAYLARGTEADVARAARVGDVLVAVQSADVAGDGRVRSSYMSSPAVGSRGADVANAATMTGNQAWVGLALVALHQRTGDARYLTAALRTAELLLGSTYDTRGVGGFAGGWTAGGAKIGWRSTEHNIDCVAFFGRLASVTGDARWAAASESARRFVRSMWAGTHFHVGTLDDGTTPNTWPIFEDVQSWSWLALGETAHSASVDWAWDNLVTTDGAVTGPRVFFTTQQKVWVEGTCQLATALVSRGAPGDAERAATLRASIWTAQTTGSAADGRGVPAASSDGLDDGYGETIYASLHTGATAWAVFAELGVNPLAS
ncbi:hypothetical protein [Sanguibacter suaedae]|uniref:Tat pathway signal sequence domain protein n=1 Tax=Sanguibacter suaedae TaxID=2795737 RepID=A0A934ICY3_9MICO|nr:hypothetical protein [Sanguibacter suaedae]MBI9115658.1 hypothetical protein [Sanguibacter suaedae]